MEPKKLILARYSITFLLKKWVRMKSSILILSALFLITGCHFNKNDDLKKNAYIEPVRDQKKSETIKELEKRLELPEIEGVRISYSNMSKLDELSYQLEDLKITESKSGIDIDSYNSFEWGAVKLFFKNDALIVTPGDDQFKITYSVLNGKIVRKSSCKFLDNKIDSDKLDILLNKASAKKPEWETIFYGIFNLALSGNTKAYEFFLKPTNNQKEYLKNSDGAASIEPIIKVLKFMSENGCVWR